jgi:hypothetical protein
LPGGIPDLELHRLALAGDGFDLEVDPDRRNIVLAEYVVRESDEEAGFARSGVANEEDLWSEKEKKLKRRSLE